MTLLLLGDHRRLPVSGDHCMAPLKICEHMRQKYIDEKVGVYFIFGESQGGVDISDGDSDIFTGVTKEQADRICKAQEEFREKLYEIFDCASPKAYSGSIRDRVFEENKPHKMQ